MTNEIKLPSFKSWVMDEQEKRDMQELKDEMKRAHAIARVMEENKEVLAKLAKGEE